MVAGEPGGSVPGVRARLVELWPGAKVFDHHGMTEVGPVTFQCSVRPGMLHVIESAFYAEVIDPINGQPARPGQTGELVLTTLGRIGSPLIRYRTGDLVKREAADGKGESPCACGRHDLVLEGGILGRTDEMVVVRGVNVYPSAIEDIVRACGGIAEYQVHLSTANSLPEISLQIEPHSDSPDPAALARKLETSFQTGLALRIPVTLVPDGTLPRFEMKGRRWLRH
jgi:phenylacetate-CoA ligase